MKCYFASGWFTPNQLDTYKKCKKVLNSFADKNLKVFYPLDESKDDQFNLDNKEGRVRIFDRNVMGIDNCDFIVISTEDKDMGSLFEAGVAWMKKVPIVYVNFNLPEGGKFNLMLTESCVAIARSNRQLKQIVNSIIVSGFDSPILNVYKNERSAE